MMSDRHFIKRLCRAARPWCAIVLLFVLTILSAQNAQAQWRVLKAFPAQVRSVFFLDRQSAPSTGFVGLVDGEIWKTIDNGASWSKSVTPLPNLVGIPVSSFTFKDQQTGWAGVSANSSYNGVWKTVDGGVTWTKLPSISGNIVSVGYNVSSGVLIAISWTGASQLSNDEGGTWTAFATQYQNGVWFDGNVGVIANLRAPTFLYTNDGGQNWTSCSPTLPTECWSPWIFPGTSIFAAVSEKSREVFISSNAGMSWTVKYTFPLNAIPRGCIMGGGTDLYVQTSQGYYVSHDTGVNWFSLCGPSSDLDTRFYAKGPEIFSGEFGSNLWYLPNAGASTLAQLAFSSDVYTTSAARCTTQDSTFVFKLATTCSTVLTSVQLLQGAPQFQVIAGTLPRTILGGGDSIRIRYTPGAAPRDSGLVRLRFTVAGRTIDTVIALYATARGGFSRVALNTTVTMTLASACAVKDTTVVLRNLGCDSVFVLSAAVDDPTHISLSSLALPKGLASNDSLMLRLTGGSHFDGTYFTTLRLHIRTATQEYDTSVVVWLTVASSAKPAILPLALRVVDRCTAVDTALRILNPSCDSIRILAVRLSDTTVFKLLDQNFPRTLRSNDSSSLQVYASAKGKGSFATTVTVTYLDVDGYRHDTSVFIVLDVQKALPVRVDMATTKLDLGIANAPCGIMSGSLRLWNTLCGTAKIVAVRWATPDTEFVASFGKLPIVLGSMDTTSIQLAYTPKQIGKKARQLIVTIEVDGVRRDTSITVSGSGESFFDARVLQASVNYDSLLLCESREREAMIVNASCDDMILTRADIGFAAGYRIVSPALPLTLRPLDTATFRVLLTPAKSGPATDPVFVWMHLKADPTEHLRTIGLLGYVAPSERRFQLEPNAIAFQAIEPCTSRDTVLVLRNFNPCESLVVSKVSVSGNLPVALDPSTVLPATISSGGRSEFKLHLDPIVDTLQTAFVHIVGNWIDTVIEISAVASSSGRALTLGDGDSVLETRPCIPVSITRPIVNEGCNPLLVDSLLLVAATSQTQLSLSSSRTMPFVLQPGEKTDVTIRYEPDGNGDGTGELRIVSGQARFARGVKIRGVVTGSVPVMRMQVEGYNSTGAVLRELPGRSISVQLRALDVVDPSIPLRSAECDLSFDPDVLVLAQITPHTGWQLRDRRELALGRVHCVFDWSGGSIAALDPIAQVFFETRLADTTTTQIRVSDVRLNPDDPDFERCVLSSLSTGEAVTFVVNDTCGTALMRTLMQGKPLLEIIRIAPDPVTTASESSSITLVSSVAQRAEFRIVAADGSIVRSFDQDLSDGSSTLPIPLAGIPSGSYTLTVSVPMMTRSTRFIIAR
jgi:photosystem II stability/assembly factor-like uncharacterized protein